MKIVIEQKTGLDEYYMDKENSSDFYTLKAELSSSEDATIATIVDMFFNAACIESYHPINIMQAMYECALEKAYDAGCTLDRYELDETCIKDKLNNVTSEDF